MRILYLNPVGVLGGAEHSLLDILASVPQADPAAELSLVVGTDGSLVERAEKLNARVLVLPMPVRMRKMGDSGLTGRNRLRAVLTLAMQGTAAGWATWGYMQRVRQVVQEFQPDVIHSNGMKFHLLTRLGGGKAVPVVWHIRDFLSYRPVMARALRWASARACGAIAISQAVGRDARTLLPRLPINVMYNAIDTDYFSPGPGDGLRLDRLAGFAPAEPATIRVGLVATFARWKGQEVFLESAARLVGEQPQVPLRFYIIGGPIYQTGGSQFLESELRAKAAALGLASRVGFIGFQDNTADIYRALDIVVHASTLPEPFGRTIVEAMACGRPVVVARAGGAVELFTQNQDALGVPPCDSRALAFALRALVQDPESRLRLSANARRTAVKRFSRERLGRELVMLYQRLAKTSQAVAPQAALVEG